MSAIRSVLMASVIALGVGLAPIAQADPDSPAAAKAMSAPTTTPSKSTATTSSKSHMKIDLNTASHEQLMTLPGMTQATADKIVQARPFKSKDELRSKNIVTKSEYDKLASHVMTKATTTTKK